MTDKREGVSYADVFQLASATAIELAGGPKIPLRFGRRDARNEEDCCPEGRLPGGRPTLLRDCYSMCIWRSALLRLPSSGGVAAYHPDPMYGAKLPGEVSPALRFA